MNTIPFGIGVATSARVGNLLGARNAKGAARAANVAAWLSMIMGAVVLAILMSTRHVFAKIFNDDERVVKLTAEVLPYVALFQIAGKSQFLLSSIIPCLAVLSAFTTHVPGGIPTPQEHIITHHSSRVWQ
jgi:Na+-driven multidrug efflux pump